MSTFSGLFNEIPGVSADRFLERNRAESTVFFLSHCHTDHMVGLHLPEPLPGPLYTSPISAVFLKHRYPYLVENIRTLDIGDTTTIPSETDCLGRELRVTTIPAGHCPGSVMFLFETEGNQQILYTGDFRLSPKDLRNILALRDVTLKVVYLDTTFFNRQYNYFPAQSESLAKIVQLTSDWLALDGRNVISFKLPALYGSEFLFMELSRQLNQRIHVKQQELQKYRFLHCLDKTVTSDESACRIHACLGTSFANYWHLPCLPELDAKYVRVIRPSALRWRGLSSGEPCWKRLRQDKEEYSVCYSNHASYGELDDFLRYLGPKEVRFNVLPSGDPEGLQMRLLLGEIGAGQTKEDEPKEREPMRFDNIVYRKSSGKSRNKSCDEEFSSEDESVIDKLPKRIRS